MRLIQMLASSALLVLLFMVGQGQAHALQVGVNSSDAGNAYGARARLTEPSEYVNGGRDRAYYIATTLPDGWFFQAGYNDAADDYPAGTYSEYCSSGFTWFVTGLLGSSYLGPNLYNTGYCDMAGSRLFTLQAERLEGEVDWQFSRSGEPTKSIGPVLALPSSQGSFAKTNTGITSELVSADNPPEETFPTEEYDDPALQFQSSVGGAWTDTAHAHFYASSDRTCYWALTYVTNDVRTGQQDVIHAAHCHANGDPLW